MERDIKEVLAEIDQRFEFLVDRLGDSLEAEQWEELQEGLIQAKQLAVVDYLGKLEASGAECPSISEVVSWFGNVPSDVVEIAKQLDGMDEEQQAVALDVMERAVDIAQSEGEEAAVEFVQKLSDEIELNRINEMLADAAEQGRESDLEAELCAVIESLVDEEAVAAFNQAVNEELKADYTPSLDEIKRRVAEFADFALKNIPGSSVTQTTDRDGNQINISFYLSER